MKIGINARLLQEKYHTGIQNYIKNLYEAVQDLEPKNEYLFLNNQNNSNLLKNVLFDNLLIKKQIKNSQADLFHSPGAVLPLGKKICPYLATVHDLGFKKFPHLGRKLDIAYYNFVFKNLIKQADLIITDSLAIKDEMQKYYCVNDSRLRIVPLGIDEFYFHREEKEYLDEIKAKYNLAGQKIVLTNSGHSVRKNIPSLVKACKLVPDCLLVVIGVIAKINRPASTVWLDYLPKREVRAFYQLADIFVYPSFYEGFGLPILEAMASQTLVLASDIPAFREIIADDKFLFDPLNIQEISEKISANLNMNDSQRQAILYSYWKILDAFSWKKTAEKMINIFNSFKK